MKPFARDRKYLCNLTIIYTGDSFKLNITEQKIFVLSKQFFGIHTFFNDAMTDGIFELLPNTKKRMAVFKSTNGLNNEIFQHSLFPD
jgi:hypothetical protein